MRKDPFNLRELLEPAVRALGYELVGIEYHPSGKHSVLRIYIDSEAGITLEDCTTVSHQVSGILDVEDTVPGQYSLEISSPGLDRPLFQAADYERFRGQRVKLRTRLPVDGQRKFKGLLQGLRQEDVVIVDDEGKEVCLPLDQIEQARLVPEIQG